MARENDVRRRRLLAGIASGIATTVTIGSAAGRRNGRGSKQDRYIVGAGTPDACTEARNCARSVRHDLDFGDVGWAVAGAFPEPAIEALERRPDVSYVERDGEVRALDHATDEGAADPAEEGVVPWGIDRIDAVAAHHDGETGAGASVAIVDTGIDPDHESLEVAGGTAFVECEGDCAEAWGDDRGHGTHCAGTAVAPDGDVGVVGASTGADLYAVKVLDADGGGTWSDVAAGIEWVADRGIDVANLSLGGGYSETVKNACGYAAEKGTLLVSSAGNGGSDGDSLTYPAAYEECVAVGATDEDDRLADFSSRGDGIELVAPGVNVLSTVPGDDYERRSGTSMASAAVAGVAGLVRAADPDRSNEQVREHLRETAADLDLAEAEGGHGLVDAAAAAGTAGDEGTDSGECGDEVTTASADGHLSVWWDESDSYGYDLRTANPCRATVALDGPADATFDLYLTVDGRTPTTSDYDERSYNWGADEEIAVDLDGDETFGILVDAYSGSGSYTLTVEEFGA